MSYNPVPKLTNGNATFDNDLNVSGISTFDAGIKTPLNTIVDGATITFDMDSSNNHSVILGGNRTLAVSNVDAGQKFTIRLKQDSAGNRSPVWWGGITWLTSNGSDPTLKTGGGEIDYFGFISTSGGYYEGFHLTEAGGGGGGGSSTMTVKEADGTPNVSNVSTIVVSNGTLTNDGGGQVTITTGGGGGGSYDDTYVSGVSTFASGLAIQNQADIVTVSGLLYSDTAISGYFESRVDSADSSVTANSGYFESRVDSADSSITANSGYFESRVDTNAADIITVSGLTGGGSSLTVQDIDGSPSVSNVTTIKVTNGSLTDNGGGVVTIATSGSGGGGGTSYTAGSGLTLTGTEFNVYGGSGNFEHVELSTNNNVVPTFKFLGSGVTDTPINLEVRSSLQSATGSGTALLFQGSQGQLFSITDNLSSGVIFNVSDITGLPMLEVTASGDVEIGEFADNITIHQPVLLSGGVPTDTANKLYNDAGTLKFNGSAIGGGGGLPYSSGDYYLQEIRANSASGVAISGSIPPNTFNITGGDGNNYTIDGMGLNSASDPTMYVHKGHTYIFNKTFSGHPFAVSATDGGSVYSDADGNNIEIGSAAGSVTFEVPQNAPDKLYYYCTAHPSNMKGVIYTTTDGSLSGYFESRVDTNAADIVTVSGLTGGGGGSYTAGSGLILTGTEFNVYGGSGNFANLEIKPNVTTDTGLIVQSAVSQTANLQEWQDSSENVLSHVDTSGVYTNIIGSAGTDTLRVQFGDAESNQTVASNSDIKGVWLDFEDGSEYTAGTINGNGLLLGTWYNTAKTSKTNFQIKGNSLLFQIANSSKFNIQGTISKFNTDIEPWSANSWDLGDPAKPWKNIYASGLSVSGVELTNHIPVDTTNRLYNDGGTLKFNGSAVGGGSSYTAGSGLTLAGTEFNVYGGSGNFENIDLTTDGTTVPKMVFTGSGVTDTPIRMKVLSSHASASTSGTALSFEGAEGQLFGITDNLSSGTIFSVNDITGLPMIEVDASGDVKVGRFANSVVIYSPSVSGSVQGDLNVTGAFTATTKSFLIDHPTKEGMKLQYASLEGPENGVYIRGTSGSNIITLPEYWSTLVDQSTVTVSLTAIGYYQALYIEEKGKNYIKVGGSKGSYDYVVYGERKDVEKLKVEW